MVVAAAAGYGFGRQADPAPAAAPDGSAATSTETVPTPPEAGQGAFPGSAEQQLGPGNDLEGRSEQAPRYGGQPGTAGPTQGPTTQSSGS